MTIRNSAALLATLEGYGLIEGEGLTQGSVFYVDSGHAGAADTTSNGTSWESPCATVDYAIGLCTAGQYDIIYVASRHAETIDPTVGTDLLLVLDVIGVTIVGLGKGSNRPTFTLGATAAIIDVNAASCTIKNCIFIVGDFNVTTMIDVDGADFTLEDCLLTMTITSYEAVDGIDLGAANAVVKNCVITATTAAGADAGIELSAAVDNIQIIGCRVIGNFQEASIHNPTGNVATNLLIQDCILGNEQTGDWCLELVSACTGNLIRNTYNADTDAALVDPGSCFSFECYGCDTVDTSGFLLPAEGSAT